MENIERERERDVNQMLQHKHKVKVAGSNNYYKEQGVNISCLSSNKAFITI